MVGASEDAAADDRINADRSNGGIDIGASVVDIGASVVVAGASVVGAPEDAAADDRINADRSNGGIDIGASVVGAPASVDHLNILVGGIGVSSDDPTDDDRRHADMLANGIIDIGASVAVGAPAFAPV